MLVVECVHYVGHPQDGRHGKVRVGEQTVSIGGCHAVRNAVNRRIQPVLSIAWSERSMRLSSVSSRGELSRSFTTRFHPIAAAPTLGTSPNWQPSTDGLVATLQQLLFDVGHGPDHAAHQHGTDGHAASRPQQGQRRRLGSGISRRHRLGIARPMRSVPNILLAATSGA